MNSKTKDSYAKVVMDSAIRDIFTQTDLILIIDTNGKVMYYEDFNDEINMLRYENVIGRSIFDLYPFFRREDFTIFQAMDQQKAILNKLQQFEVNGVPKKVLNSAYPLINDTGLVGGLVMSVQLENRWSGRVRNHISQAKYNFSDIITQNKAFLESFVKLQRIANGNANVLIYGETGTGKELIAHTIHANSPRRNKPFIIQNCAAIPPNLMESILYGSAKGSFTGAIDKAGLFEVAEGGTLYLDEVNSMPLEQQGKLLRALENHSIRRVGENFERQIDVRVIASTNEMLDKMIERGEFRRDLLYRLNVASFTIPPLRKRPDDIPLLCEHYIQHYDALLNRSIIGLSDEVLNFFMRYPWEGNVRELKNVCEYVCNIKTRGEVTMDDIPEYMFRSSSPITNFLDNALSKDMQDTNNSAEPSIRSLYPIDSSAGMIQPGQTLAQQMDAFEKEILAQAYVRNRYNITHAAKELSISRQTLYNKLKKHGIL